MTTKPPSARPTETGPQPVRGRRGRRTPWIVAAAFGVAGVLLALQVGPAIAPQGDADPTSSGPTPSRSPDGLVGRTGYLTDADDLRARAALAADGVEPYRSAVDDLLRWADRAVDRAPRPAERLRIKGTEGPFVDDTAAAYGLALAWVVTGDDRFGKAAARMIMAWVTTTTRTADTCPDDGSCQTSLIISRTVPGFVFAADLLAGSPFLSERDQTRLRVWLRDVMLPTASELTNNWGDAGTFTRVVLTDYLGDQAGFQAAIDTWRSLLDRVDADGFIPEEVARGDAGLGYTQEALDYKVAVAVIAARRGIDLWTYVGADGGSLKLAVDTLARYMDDPAAWPWSATVRRRAPSPFWELAYEHWRDPAYRGLLQERRPFGSLGHSAVRWTTMTNGIPFDGP